MSGSLSGSSMGLALIVSCYIGYSCDKKKISNLLLFAFGIGTVGMFMFAFVHSATGFLTYLAVICLNIGN